MRKQDYLILAKRIREDVAKYPGTVPPIGWTHDQHMAAVSASQQAADLGRYLADHLAVDKRAFLDACGIK